MNIEWLLTGKGEMLKPIGTTKEMSICKNEGGQIIPFKDQLKDKERIISGLERELNSKDIIIAEKERLIQSLISNRN